MRSTGASRLGSVRSSKIGDMSPGCFRLFALYRSSAARVLSNCFGSAASLKHVNTWLAMSGSSPLNAAALFLAAAAAIACGFICPRLWLRLLPLPPRPPRPAAPMPGPVPPGPPGPRPAVGFVPPPGLAPVSVNKLVVHKMGQCSEFEEC